jgi:hypothetical protein
VRFLICALRERIRVEIMVGLGGLEPPTSPLSGARSNHLSYRPKDLRSGGADRDRTGDPLLAKQVLSQLSYSPHWDVRLILDMQVSCVDAME